MIKGLGREKQVGQAFVATFLVEVCSKKAINALVDSHLQHCPFYLLSLDQFARHLVKLTFSFQEDTTTYLSEIYSWVHVLGAFRLQLPAREISRGTSV